jgi:hypothetical protein
MTSSKASGFLSSSLRGTIAGAWVGVEAFDRLGARRRRRRSGDLEDEVPVGEKGSGSRGAVEVK